MLLPPIVDTYAPIFLLHTDSQQDECKIPFKISPYMSVGDISKLEVEIIVFDQHTNKKVSILTENKSIQLENEKDDYFIVLDNEDLKDGFHVNVFYKAQLRFVDNDKHSEWSTICLLHGIKEPVLNRIAPGLEADKLITLNTTVLTILGKINFNSEVSAKGTEHETLESYQLLLYKGDLNQLEEDLIEDSGILYTNKYNGANDINYTFKHQLEEQHNYYVKLKYTTLNQYHGEDIVYTNIKSSLDDLAKINGVFTVVPNVDIGGFEIKIEPLESDKGVIFSGEIAIRRTSSRSEFTIWEDIIYEPFKEETLSKTWYDYTIESDIWYKYAIQQIKRNKVTGYIESRGIITENEAPVIIGLEDMFLTAGNKQLRIQANQTVDSYAHAIVENKIDTLGSQYPFITRNGAMNYRQFNISGYITSVLNDVEDQQYFLSEADIYNHSADIRQLYNDYNENNRINKYNNVFYEKEFRDAVTNFLYDNSIKLFRSGTEGNILVKLMNINFTPEQSLGRLIYSFSASAYEIDDFSLENCNKYNINAGSLSFDPEWDGDPSYYIFKNDELNMMFQQDIDIMDILHDKYKYLTTKTHKAIFKQLDNLIITFDEPPKPLIYNGIEWNYANSKDGVYHKMGYLVNINNVQVCVDKDGIYHVPIDTAVFHLSFPKNTQVKIDFSVSIRHISIPKEEIKVESYKDVIGQIHQLLIPDISVYKIIENKYLYKDNFKQIRLVSLNGVQIESVPGAYFTYQNLEEGTTWRDFVINETQFLNLQDEDLVVLDLVYKGIKLYPETILNRVSLKEQYFIDRTKEHNLNIIDNNIAFTDTDKKTYIYYKNQKCPCEILEDGSCLVKYNIFSTINYWGELEAGDVSVKE